MLESATVVFNCEQILLALDPSYDLVRDGLGHGSLLLILFLSLLWRLLILAVSIYVHVGVDRVLIFRAQQTSVVFS